ncbi:Citrate-sodium symporter [Gossypium arboreum]|uniref:Citrate-sodium symporter n=1 Tax=Gossypium arboreum TaxID=29729 RepID=A0A0B0MGS1_GOSAR|nr:Citrate-sodium symporter [Gossypium arboreum]
MSMPCHRHGLTLTIQIEADAMSQTWSYSDTSRSRCMSQTCLTLAYITRQMYVPDMSYTSSHFNADTMSQTWSYTCSHNVADACPRHVLQ